MEICYAKLPRPELPDVEIRKLSQIRITFPNFSSLFLNHNNCFHFELEIIIVIRSEKPSGTS